MYMMKTKWMSLVRWLSDCTDQEETTQEHFPQSCSCLVEDFGVEHTFLWWWKLVSIEVGSECVMILSSYIRMEVIWIFFMQVALSCHATSGRIISVVSRFLLNICELQSIHGNGRHLLLSSSRYGHFPSSIVAEIKGYSV